MRIGRSRGPQLRLERVPAALSPRPLASDPRAPGHSSYILPQRRSEARALLGLQLSSCPERLERKVQLRRGSCRRDRWWVRRELQMDRALALISEQIRCQLSRPGVVRSEALGAGQALVVALLISRMKKACLPLAPMMKETRAALPLMVTFPRVRCRGWRGVRRALGLRGRAGCCRDR